MRLQEIPTSNVVRDVHVYLDRDLPALIVHVATHLLQDTLDGRDAEEVHFFVTNKDQPDSVIHKVEHRLDIGLRIYYPLPDIPDEISVWVDPYRKPMCYGFETLE